jgi:uncharacterized protein YkwD
MKKGTLPWQGWLLASLLLFSCTLADLANSKPIGYYKVPTPTLADCGQTFQSDMESQILELLNQARSLHGLPALVLNDLLMGAARRHSTDMACNNFMGNTGSDGATWHELMVQAGYLVKYGGIATAGGYANDPAALIQAWSQQTDGIIDDTTATEIGVGVVFKDGTKYGVYWTVLYALPNR